MKTINTEIATLLLVGFVLTVAGIYMNFENLDLAQRKNVDPGMLNSNEMAYGLMQIVGMAVIAVGVMRSLLRRSDLMTNKFVNIMDVFTSLVKKQLELMDEQGQAASISEIDEKSRMFKKELRGLKRI